MKPSKNCIDLIKKFEGFRDKAYLCPANVVTIGFGSTTWADGKKIKMGEVISMDGAEKLLAIDLGKRVKALEGLNINQNQIDSLLSFIYNVGVGAFKRSTLLRKVKANPQDSTIHDEFMRWVNKGSPFEKGLKRRRTAESNLYFA
jgi:lysozyme